MTIWDSLFWKDTVERVVFTVAQLLIAVLSADGLDLLQIDFTATVTTLAIAAGLVILKCIVANSVTSGTVSPASFAKDDRGI
jgi:hypothetical protein